MGQIQDHNKYEKLISGDFNETPNNIVFNIELLNRAYNDFDGTSAKEFYLFLLNYKYELDKKNKQKH